jgi:hypothetical protein
MICHVGSDRRPPESCASTQPCAAETQHYGSGCCAATTPLLEHMVQYVSGTRLRSSCVFSEEMVFREQSTGKHSCNVIVGYHDTYCRMRETLDPGSTSDRTWRFMVWRGPPRAASDFWRAAMLQSDPEGPLMLISTNQV